jgi:ubiquitin carboxyl-terminal hydrolase 14
MISSKTLTFSYTNIVNVKWGKEQFNNVEVNTAEEPLVFKSQLYALSNVPVDKQKIMIKGKILKDEDNLSKVGLTNGMTIMMMGTAEGN